MKRLSRDTWVAIGIFVVLVAITAIAAIQQAREERSLPPLLNGSSQPDGALALWLWLDEVGYDVSDEVGAVFQLPPEAGVALMLEPSTGVTAEEWEEIDDWVAGGGTLVLAGDGVGAYFAVGHYDVGLAYTGDAGPLTVRAPLLASPPLVEPVNGRPRAHFESQRDDLVVHLASESGPVVVSFEPGSGRVILCSIPFPFSNAGLKEEGNPELVLNVIAAAGRSDTIWFDEWHHGVRDEVGQQVGPGAWLRETPSGRSVLYVAVVVFLALVLRGRVFGRPVPPSREIFRRAPLEHITAIANLNRRAGHRQSLLEQYRHWLKRDLGRRYRLSPALPDGEYVERLAGLNPNLDGPALSSLLQRLSGTRVSESEMIQLAAEVADWVKES